MSNENEKHHKKLIKDVNESIEKDGSATLELIPSEKHIGAIDEIYKVIEDAELTSLEVLGLLEYMKLGISAQVIFDYYKEKTEKKC